MSLERGCNEKQRTAKALVMFVTRGNWGAGWLPHHPISSAFFCKNVLKWNIKMGYSSFRSRPKEFHIEVLTIEYYIHIGWVLSLFPQEERKHQLSLLH